ncbi:hypothetical protein INT48_003117 [Thamnidium elegans]|uniref:Uncharacterized protein n=1 Tax=Thamnidium elegans TaxID=101142 RepID=A0A8H7W1Z4_9FUNG|nr:hypothetical protein INT48_003117 [Thamnidium elegans]
MLVVSCAWNLRLALTILMNYCRRSKNSMKKTNSLWSMEERLNGYEKVRRLDRLLADNVEVKLSSRVSEADGIYVYSSPLCPDSPYNNQ